MKKYKYIVTNEQDWAEINCQEFEILDTLKKARELKKEKNCKMYKDILQYEANEDNDLITENGYKKVY